ncbi:hypothetical protein BKA70DRAFT_1036121, partial [Coprinopsis sp. MPI-PUGE-AT-0042]
KNINALNLPMPSGLRPMRRFPFASDYTAWLRTQHNDMCFAFYPVEAMHWGLFAYNGALHFLHIDADGFGTWVEVKSGLKLWVVAHPKKSSDVSLVGTIDAFSKRFAGGKYPNSQWIYEAVVLGPNTRLVMAPHTPHAVWTMEDAICHGGHFYSISTLSQTVVGMIHTFVRDEDLTNTSHTAASRLLLRRIVHFLHQAFVLKNENANSSNDAEHLPDLVDPAMFLGTLSLLSAIELQNILDPRSYILPNTADTASVWFAVSEPSLLLCDVNKIPHQERTECIYTRGLALELVRWISTRYHLVATDTANSTLPTTEDTVFDFYYYLVAHITVAVLAYKERHSTSSQCTLDLLKQQIQFCVDGNPGLK